MNPTTARWKVSRTKGRCPACLKQPGYRVTLADGSGALIAVVTGRCAWGDDAQRLAQLVAASPALLRELRQYVIQCPCGRHSEGSIRYDWPCQRCHKAVTAIAKAEGRKPYAPERHPGADPEPG